MQASEVSIHYNQNGRKPTWICLISLVESFCFAHLRSFPLHSRLTRQRDW